ncbi:MAG: DNRLRE domain-containing protein [Methanotrichaceae archaeon]|nr:DNRLRE domain-containing protein [Methanotrichaceae archaeon]
MDRFKLEPTDKGFTVNGTVTCTNLNPPGQVVEYDNLDVVAYIKESSSSQYPKLPESRYVVYPAGAETPYTKGSGPGETMTKAEYEGVGIKRINIASIPIRPNPVWSNYGGLDDWQKKAPATVTKDFGGISPTEYDGKEARIVATLSHSWGGPYASWPAFSFSHSVAYEGRVGTASSSQSALENATITNATSLTTVPLREGLSFSFTEPGSIWMPGPTGIVSPKGGTELQIVQFKSSDNELAYTIRINRNGEPVYIFTGEDKAGKKWTSYDLSNIENLGFVKDPISGKIKHFIMSSKDIESLMNPKPIAPSMRAATPVPAAHPEPIAFIKSPGYGIDSLGRPVPGGPYDIIKVDISQDTLDTLLISGGRTLVQFGFGFWPSVLFAISGYTTKWAASELGEVYEMSKINNQNLAGPLESSNNIVASEWAGEHFLLKSSGYIVPISPNQTFILVEEGTVSLLNDKTGFEVPAGFAAMLCPGKRELVRIDDLNRTLLGGCEEFYKEMGRSATTQPVLEIAELKDARVYEYPYLNWNNANWGAWDYLALKSEVNGIQDTAGRIYIWFDPALLGELSQDQSVYLQLVHWPTEQVGNITADIFRVTEPWVEGNGTYHPGMDEPDASGTISWSNQPAWDSGTAWSSQELYPNANPYNISWDITELVKAWTTGQFANYGLVIVGRNEGATGYSHIFGSSENADNALRPTIFIKASESSETADGTVNDSQGSLSKDVNVNQSQEYLFLEVWTDENGTVLEGIPVSTMIDFPTYFIRDSMLTTMSPIDIGAKVKALIGIGSSLSGDLGGGAASSLYSIDQLPYDANGVKIVRINGDKATFDYQGKQITLGPDEEFRDSVEEFRTVAESKYKVEITTIIKNYGRVKLQGGDDPPLPV